MKNLVVLLLVFTLNQLSILEGIGQITGMVTDAKQQPLPNVHIIKKGTDGGTQTDNQGKYTINANPGEMLLFSFIGMQPEEVFVDRSPSVINVSMRTIYIELEELEIKAEYEKTHKSQKELLTEYPENENLIKTSIGILDKDLSSTAIHIIDGDELIPAGKDFLYSLENHYLPMKVVRDDPRSPGEIKVYLRQITGSPSSALFDVDGFTTEFTPSYLSANDIKRIAILEGNAALARYGPQGKGGVIVINTRAQTEMDDLGVIRFYDNRALADSLKRRVTYLEPFRPKEPLYIKELKAARTKKKALSIYENQKDSYFNDPYYFLEVYDLFLSRWGVNSTSKELFQDVRTRMPDAVPVLKALAYLQQQYGNYEAALNLYIQILMMQSWEAQPLRDVANAYSEVGDYKKAWMYYTQYIDILSHMPGTYFDAQGEDLLITTEMIGILDRTEEPFLEKRDTVSILDEDMRTRLVFEWTNQQAEFELQFVSPEGFYDTWNHKPGGDVTQDPEVAKGYCSKQFFLGKENTGLWQVNIDYKGNRTELPTYLKVSIYRNFGLDDQDLEVEVYKLYEEQEKAQLLTFLQN